MSSSYSTLHPVNRKDEPWLGLYPYLETDEEYYFGREKEAEDLLRLLNREVLTVIFGPSGSGKSSLLNAGLFSKLRRNCLLPVPIRLDYSSARGDLTVQVKQEIARAIETNGIEEEFHYSLPEGERETLWEYLNRVDLWDKRSNPVHLVLVFDQFEEIFTLGSNSQATEVLLKELAAVVENHIPDTVRATFEKSEGRPRFQESRPNYKVLLALREDLVSRLDGLRQRMPSVMHNRFPLEPMHGEQALRPVLFPGRGIVSQEVAEKIIRKVASVEGVKGTQELELARLEDLTVEPPLLSLMCSELNLRRLRDKKSEITGDLVDNAAADILSDFYERALLGLNPEARTFVEDRLLTAEGFRTTIALDTARRAGLEGDMAVLVNRRLLRCEDRLGLPHLELTHDVLTKVVRKSRDERQERERREEEDRQRTELETQRAKEEASRRRELAQARRLVTIAFGAAAVCLLLGGMCLLFYLRVRYEKQKALDTRYELLAKTLTIHVQNLQQSGRDDDLSYLLLKKASQLNANEPSLGDAYFAIYRQPFSVKALPSGVRRLDSVHWSPDGTRVAAAGSGDRIFIWRLDQDRSQDQVPCPSRSCSAVAWSPDSQNLAFGEETGDVNVWNAKSGKTSPRTRMHGEGVTSLAWLSQSQFITVGRDGLALIWDLERDADVPVQLPSLAKPLYTVAYDKTGDRIAIGGYKMLGIWDRAKGGWLLRRDAVNVISSVAWSPNGFLAAGGWSGLVSVYDSGLTSVMNYLLPSRRRIHAVAWLNDNNTIVVGSLDQNLILITAHGKNEKPLLMTGTAGTVKALSASQSEPRFAQIGDDQFVRLWSDTGRGSAKTLARHEAAISGLNWSEDGRFLLSSGTDDRIVAWDLSDPDAESKILIGPQGFRPIADLFSLSPATPAVYALGAWQDEEGKARRSGLAGWGPGALVYRLKTFDWSRWNSFLPLAPNMTRAALSADKTLLAVGGTEGYVAILARTGDTWRTLVGPLRTGLGEIESLAWQSPDELVAVDREGVAKKLRRDGSLTTAGRKIDRCDSQLPVASTPDGAMVAQYCQDGIRIGPGSNSTASSQNRTTVVKDPGGVVSAMKWSPEGRYLAYGLVSGRTSIVDAKSPTDRYGTLLAHRGSVTALSWSKDGKSLASGGSDSEVHVWPTKSFQLDFCGSVTRPLRQEENKLYLGLEMIDDPCGRGKQ